MNMIIYNKNLQKKCGVDIEYYKKKSGKYKIGGKNGLGKELKLNTDNLIFEGEYLNGKRHGKGREYDTDNTPILKFEGQYLNGKKNGKGRTYYYNGELEFDGEYLNGMKHGICKEYDSSGKLIFEGEYLNDLKWNGKGYKNDILEFEIKKGSGKIKKYLNDKLI